MLAVWQTGSIAAGMTALAGCFSTLLWAHAGSGSKVDGKPHSLESLVIHDSRCTCTVQDASKPRFMKDHSQRGYILLE